MSVQRLTRLIRFEPRKNFDASCFWLELSEKICGSFVRLESLEIGDSFAPKIVGDCTMFKIRQSRRNMVRIYINGLVSSGSVWNSPA
jgi:hypothetical protein